MPPKAAPRAPQRNLIDNILLTTRRYMPHVMRVHLCQHSLLAYTPLYIYNLSQKS